MRQWETAINRLIKENIDRRYSDRSNSRMMVHASSMSAPRQSMSTVSSQTYVDSLPSRPSSSAHVRRKLAPYGSEEQIAPVPNGLYSGPNGYPPHEDDGFDFEPDDEYEDYPPSSYPPSGRETPMSMPRRMTSQITVDRDSHYSVPERPRARTEDHNGPNMIQWRSQNGMPPPPVPHPYGSPHPPALSVGNPASMRPPVPRMQSNQSAASFNSTASGDSFGPGVKPRLRSQFSSTRLKSSYEAAEVLPNGVLPSGQNLPPSIQRSRSASQPSAYIPRAADPPPPMPPAPWLQQRGANGIENKRGSGSSASTVESSDESPNSSSPITPYASSESSLGGISVKPSSKSHTFDNMPTPTASLMPGGIKIKVHFNEDIFLVQLPRNAEYEALVERVTKKIRLCGGRREDGPLRLKYRDEDGDLVSLGSTEDVQMAFEALRPGGQVTIYVA
jgi:cell division control protein 24